MDLCHICQTIDIRNLLQAFHNSEQFAALLRGEPWGRHACRTSANFQYHQASLAALRDAGDSGCRLCGMIWARHCSQRAEHGTDDCMCKRYSGPVRFTVHQGSCDSFVLLVVLAVSETGEQGDPDAEMVAELEICTAKGIY